MPRLKPKNQAVVMTAPKRQDARPLQLTDLDGILPPSSAPAFPVGSIYETWVPTNPAVLLGYGTWTLFATGVGDSGALLIVTVE